jgi:hypothetical protein
LDWHKKEDFVSDRQKVASGQISVASISLDPAEWNLAEENPDENVFVSKVGDVCGVEYRTEETAFKVDFSDLVALRVNIREGFGGAGLISADVESFGSGQHTIKGIVIVTKLPQIPSGLSYNGLIFLPFKDFSYSLYMRYEEAGVTGLRESVMLDLLIELGEVTLAAPGAPGGIAGQIQGLAEDLYDPSLRGHLVRNKAEREEYDQRFPEHPLTKLRAGLRRVKQNLIIDQLVLQADQGLP